MGEPECSNAVNDSHPNASKICSAINPDTKSQIAGLVDSDDFDLKSQSLKELLTEPITDSEIQTKGPHDDQGQTSFANSDSESNVESCGAITRRSKTQIAEDCDMTISELPATTACCNDTTNDSMSLNQGF